MRCLSVRISRWNTSWTSNSSTRNRTSRIYKPPLRTGRPNTPRRWRTWRESPRKSTNSGATKSCSCFLGNPASAPSPEVVSPPLFRNLTSVKYFLTYFILPLFYHYEIIFCSSMSCLCRVYIFCCIQSLMCSYTWCSYMYFLVIGSYKSCFPANMKFWVCFNPYNNQVFLWIICRIFYRHSIVSFDALNNVNLNIDFSVTVASIRERIEDLILIWLN